MTNYQTIIREPHLDTLGHVNNATYLQPLEEARWELMYQKGLDLHQIAKLGTGPIILEIDIKFLSELTLRESITIDFEILEFTGKVGKFRQHIYKSNGKISAEAIMTFATMDMKQRKIIEPSDFWIKMWELEPFIEP